MILLIYIYITLVNIDCLICSYPHLRLDQNVEEDIIMDNLRMDNLRMDNLNMDNLSMDNPTMDNLRMDNLHHMDSTRILFIVSTTIYNY